MFPLVVTGVVDNGGKFAAGVVDTRGDLPPAGNVPLVSLTLVANVSTTLRKMVENFAVGVVDTGGAP